ncbi:MAG: hypothetical protein E7182_06280 [Erysipelotrichaceae bacterium]|nr:hypothetical protein [Erysipelotrichaceae bacterium]
MAEQKTKEKTLAQAGKDLAEALKGLASSSPSFAATKDLVKADGENYLRQTERIEVKAFDDSFVVEMEEGFEAIGRIIANPRSFIKEQPELVEAGLAKKISALSVSHLASHSQFVRHVDEKKNVHPDKILTIFSETDNQIYENRFIMTLIRKCMVFLQERYTFMIEHGETYDSDLLLLHTKTEIDGLTYTIDSRIKVSQPSSDAGESKRNEELLRRMATLRQRVAYFNRSPFMEEMKGAKEVSSPIHMTNMLLKQPDYHRAYELWCFLDEYESMGISFDVTETNQRFDPNYFDRIYNLLTASLLTLSSHRVKDRVPHTPNNTEKTTFEPAVIFTLEDETYDNGRFLYNHFPEEKKKRENPLALTPEEAVAEQKALEALIEKQRKAKPQIEADILHDKDRIVLELATARKKAKEELDQKKKEAEGNRKAKEAKAKKEADEKRLAVTKSEAKSEEEGAEAARKAAIAKGKEDRRKDRSR